MIDLQYPNLFGGDLVAWYDFTDLASITKDPITHKISKVKNKSVANISLEQSMSTLQPVWSQNGFNGWAGANFNGGNLLATESVLPVGTGSQITCVIAHLNRTASLAAGAARLIIEFSANINSSVTGFYVGYENLPSISGNGLTGTLRGNTLTTPAYSSTVNNNYYANVNQNLIIELDKSAAAISEVGLVQNGLTLPRNGGFAADLTNGFGNNVLYVGGRSDNSLFFDGYIAHIMLINRLLTSNEKINILRFLGNRLGVIVL